MYIDPVSNFTSYAKYMLSVDTAAISDLSGLGNESILYSFTVCGCPDCNGLTPKLISTNVPKWSINIPIDTTISFSFDRPIMPGNSMVRIYNYDTYDDIEFNTTISENTFYINPIYNLQAYTKYMLVLEDAAVSDVNCMGSEELFYSFTTCGCASCSGEVPQLISTNVPKWAINIPIDTTVSLSFNKPIKLGNENVRIYDWDTYEDIAMDMNIDENTLLINPSNNLQKYTKYMLSVEDGGISDFSCIGNEEILYSFTTSGAVSQLKLGDMNEDDVINILDLIWISAKMGPASTVDAKKADMNDDGQVNILDLLMVSQNVGI